MPVRHDPLNAQTHTVDLLTKVISPSACVETGCVQDRSIHATKETTVGKHAALYAPDPVILGSD